MILLGGNKWEMQSIFQNLTSSPLSKEEHMKTLTKCFLQQSQHCQCAHQTQSQAQQEQEQTWFHSALNVDLCYESISPNIAIIAHILLYCILFTVEHLDYEHVPARKSVYTNYSLYTFADRNNFVCLTSICGLLSFFNSGYFG